MDTHVLKLPKHISFLQLASQLRWFLAGPRLLEADHFAHQLLLRFVFGR